MDQHRFVEQYRIQHRHDDGSWVDMTEQRAPHDASDTDIERAWASRRIFKCTTCEETLTVVRGSVGDATGQ